ncbi:hypothetical protein HYR82_02905 [Candidatus Peregrinibacteria bacterium]|nr:hypothetical protein [Candidatus Peregrinibacteria bacterium]
MHNRFTRFGNSDREHRLVHVQEPEPSIVQTQQSIDQLSASFAQQEDLLRKALLGEPEKPAGLAAKTALMQKLQQIEAITRASFKPLMQTKTALLAEAEALYKSTVEGIQAEKANNTAAPVNEGAEVKTEKPSERAKESPTLEIMPDPNDPGVCYIPASPASSIAITYEKEEGDGVSVPDVPITFSQKEPPFKIEGILDEVNRATINGGDGFALKLDPAFQYGRLTVTMDNGRTETVLVKAGSIEQSEQSSMAPAITRNIANIRNAVKGLGVGIETA